MTYVINTLILAASAALLIVRASLVEEEVHSTVVASRHWSFVTPRRPDQPAIHDARWPRNPIDHFILAKLESEGLKPAPEADRRTLIRRLSFDLIGLPPTPEEIDAFLRDHAPNAYETVVDRLLASPYYGERQAQHWLDLARYADSDGFEYDQARPDMWRYRDWVVAALNQDVPYDRFLRLQIAGDEAAPGDFDAFIATGFNRLYPDMVDLNDQGLRRQNALNDITETTGAVVMGLTIGCARCHDHKTDPIKQKDFYALQAFFAPSRFRDDAVLASKSDREAAEAASIAWTREVGRARAAILQIELPIRSKIAEGNPPGLSDEAARAFAKAADQRDTEEVRLVYEALKSDRRVSASAVTERLEPAQRLDRDAWNARLGFFLEHPPLALPKARGIDEAAGQVPPTFLLKRGDYASRGLEVEPAFPIVLANGATPKIVATAASSGRRTALVDWLVRPDHPLTSRVMVNRLWQGHFGRGIVATPSDFGAMGEEPSHAELLDWLATEFVAKEWSMKAMHRLIATSATYRQASRVDVSSRRLDPENTLLAHQSRRRLDGEALRDAMLACSGKLNPAVGGPCIFPELPSELTKLSSKGAIWPVSPRASDRDRRSLYVFLRRNLRFPLFEAFDKPDTNASCSKRAVTTIAPQALSLLNGALSNQCAAALAARVERETDKDVGARVDRAYQLALGRKPAADESRLAGEYLREGTFADFCLALLNLNEFIYID